MPAILTIKTKGEILVSEGEKISKGDVLAQEEFVPQLISLNIAKFLAVSPKKALLFLTKKLGEGVKVSEIIAKKKSLFGLKKKIIKSPCDGILERLDGDTGELIISLPKEKKEIKSPVDGRIKRVTKGEITIEINGEQIKLKEAVGNFAKGEIFIIDKGEVELFSLSQALDGKIVCGQKWRQDTLEKAWALGALVVIGADISEVDWEKLKKGEGLLIGDNEEKLIYNLGKIEKESFVILEKNKGKIGIFEPKEKKVIIPE